MSSIELSDQKRESELLEHVSKEAAQFLMSSLLTKEPDLVILRVHLWSEKILEEIIQTTFRQPKEILSKRFSFAQKLSIVKAQICDTKNRMIFKKLNTLNNLRNEMVHNLEGKKIEKILGDFGFGFKSLKDLNENSLHSLKLDFATLWGELKGVSEVVKLNKEGIDITVVNETSNKKINTNK